jgi:MFS superfamily sulfate permease-like transporter
MCVPISFSSLLMTIDLHLAFGRVNGYKINPNQELIAIGVTNTIGTCIVVLIPKTDATFNILLPTV